jgi:hypothetical protein
MGEWYSMGGGNNECLPTVLMESRVHVALIMSRTYTCTLLVLD